MKRLLNPSETTLRLVLSLVAAGAANLAGVLPTHTPAAWEWIKMVVSTVGVLAVNWRAFVTNPNQTVPVIADPAKADPAPDPAPAEETPNVKTL